MTSLRPIAAGSLQVVEQAKPPAPTTIVHATVETLEAWTQARQTDRASRWYKSTKSRSTPMYSDAVLSHLRSLGTTLLKDRVAPLLRPNTWYGFHCGSFVTVINPSSREDLVACVAMQTAGLTFTTPAACELPPAPTPRFNCAWCEHSVVTPLRKYAQVWCSERCITAWEALQDWEPPKDTPRFIVGQGFVRA